jgi:hypothetical protein
MKFLPCDLLIGFQPDVAEVSPRGGSQKYKMRIA